MLNNRRDPIIFVDPLDTEAEESTKFRSGCGNVLFARECLSLEVTQFAYKIVQSNTLLHPTRTDQRDLFPRCQFRDVQFLKRLGLIYLDLPIQRSKISSHIFNLVA